MKTNFYPNIENIFSNISDQDCRYVSCRQEESYFLILTLFSVDLKCSKINVITLLFTCVRDVFSVALGGILQLINSPLFFCRPTTLGSKYNRYTGLNMDSRAQNDCILKSHKRNHLRSEANFFQNN